MRESASAAVRLQRAALIGNPNSGKTTVFNRLTGLRQKVGNYPGVTVERKEGRVSLDDGRVLSLIDLPGTYSLSASSPDERIATEIILGKTGFGDRPDVVVCVVDASNLERNLLLVSHIIDQEIPLIIALNMMDVAAEAGIRIIPGILESQLGVPVVPMTASRGEGIDKLREQLSRPPRVSPRGRQWPLPDPVLREWEELAGMLVETHHLPQFEAFHEAMELLSHPGPTEHDRQTFSPRILQHVERDRQKLDFLGLDPQRVSIEGRNLWISSILREAVSRSATPDSSFSDRIDAIVTHRIWGFVLFFGLMAVMFQAIFTWAEIPMNLIASFFDGMGRWIESAMPAGDLRDLVVNGALAGVSAVVTFLPQILFLFLFLGLLEDSGYMTRAAFIMDRFMRRVGLHGKSFIPLLSSFACAIPGIMATRTIERSRDRLATIMVAPLMSCSARLPVYALLIAATIPATRLFGVFSLPALTLFAMYFLGLATAFGISWIFKKTLLRGAPTAFIMELPPYRLPSVKSIAVQMWERAWVFLKRAGTLILGASIILWALATYPKLEGGTPSQRLQHSFAGQAGRAIEPAIAPLGFDWRIGIGLISSLLQREMFVSTLGTIYNVESRDAAGRLSLTQHMQNDRDPVTGRPEFSPLTGLCLMIYYVFAMQCLSTVAVVRRETNSWRWPLFQVAYMTALAYGATYLFGRVGTFLGLGG
jgi:ferrous iron transport protein B